MAIPLSFPEGSEPKNTATCEKAPGSMSEAACDAESLQRGASPSKTADPLLQCLMRIATWHGADLNPASVMAGLPVGPDGRLTIDLMMRAATRAGFRAEVIQRKIEQIPKAVLPAILLFKDGSAAVLLPSATGEDVELHLSGEDSQHEVGVSDERHGQYSGYAVLFQRTEPSVVAHSALDQSDRRQRARWFWHTLWSFRSDYLRLLPASLIVNLFAFALPFFTMMVYNRVVPNNAEETLWVLATGVTAIFAFEYILRLARGHILKTSGREMDMTLGSQLFEQVLSLEMKARPPSSGSLAGRAKSYEVLREFFVSAALLALTDVPFALLMIGLMFFIGGQIIGWVTVAGVIAAIVVQAMIQPPLRKSVVSAAEAGLERQAFITETINGLESVKAANAEGSLQHRYDRMVSDSSRKDVRSHWYSLLGDSTTKSLINFTSIAIVVAAVYEIQSGTITMGSMIACVMLGGRIMAPLAMAAGLMTRLQQTLHALRGLNAMMTMPRETGDGRHFIQQRDFRPSFALNRVTVSYPGQTQPALKDVTLTLRPGERVALIGSMGSGKSTLLRVLAKLYEPQSGEIMLDGISLAHYHPSVVRGRIGYLPQNSAIFCGTLRDNLTLGMSGVNDERLMEAVRMVGLESFVQRNSAGIHAQVGEQGCLLSGGQRQALTLARVLLRNPKMLLLDEPTSSLDIRSEQQFLRSLKMWLNADPTRSLVIATHKTSTLDLVRRVVVLHDGQVDLDGTTDQVMNALARRAAPSASVATSVRAAPQTATPQPATPANGKHVDRAPTPATTR